MRVKRTVTVLTLIGLSVLVSGCGKTKKSSKIVTKDGEMIEILTPASKDTVSWVLVTGKASVKSPWVYIELHGAESGMLQRRTVNLPVKAPDTADFEMGFLVPEPSEVPPQQKAQIIAYSEAMQETGEATITNCNIIPGQGYAQGTILRFYNALDTNDFETAHELLSTSGQAYPQFYQAEVSFAPRPKDDSALKGWKEDGERLRVIEMLPTVYYNLPEQNLFSYRVLVEHRVGDADPVMDETLVFLVRQDDGFFKLYKPRKDPYKPD